MKKEDTCKQEADEAEGDKKCGEGEGQEEEVMCEEAAAAIVSESEPDGDGDGDGKDGDDDDKNEKNEENENEKEEAPDFFLHNLCVLPPLQRKKGDGDDSASEREALDAVLLPPIQSSEPVSSIRAALSEVRGYAHLTNFRLVAEDMPDHLLSRILQRVNKASTSTSTSTSPGSTPNPTSSTPSASQTNSTTTKKKKKKKTKANQTSTHAHNKYVIPHTIVSPYTLKNALVRVPASCLSLEPNPLDSNPFQPRPIDANHLKRILDDYGDLSSLVNNQIVHSNNSGFRIVLEQYNVGSVKDHVKRVRALLEGNILLVDTLTNGMEYPSTDTPPQNSNSNTNQPLPNEPSTETNDAKKGDPTNTDNNNPRNNGKEQQDSQKPLVLPTYTLERSIAVDGTNLQDFFYLACGEEEQLNFINGVKTTDDDDEEQNQSHSKKNTNDTQQNALHLTKDESFKLNELESRCFIKCSITYSGFNPPPSSRRLYGDLAYLKVTLPGNDGVVHITACPLGFYINRTNDRSFDPSPAAQPCYSHALLDCILLKSNALRVAWADAQIASKQRSDLSASPGSMENPLKGLFQAAVKGDYYSDGATPISGQNIVDSVTLRPSWIVPVPRKLKDEGLVQSSLKAGSDHELNVARAEEDLSNYFGLDLTGGVARDWNEELQTAREMPVDTLEQRIDRARFIHKTLNEFGDASVAGAKAIFDGHITPMNPNEPARSHVYLHNNIFFSRAVDAGVDTFKIAQGDKCARKSAIRDAQCVGTLHRLDISGLYTLATVLIDYLGTRLVCQSIVPGILQGEKTHSIIYGAVEATSPLAWDKEFHTNLETNLGKGLLIASRKILSLPLTKERMEFVESMRIMPPPPPSTTEVDNENEITTVCGAVEMKGIKGSDQRSYCLDIARLTPRDANWVPKVEGGTGHWESILDSNGKKAQKHILPTLDDDEWIMAVLRPELITNLTHKKMRKFIADREATEDAKKTSDETKKDETAIPTEEPSKKKISTEDEEYMNSLRMNLNVFLPHLKSIEGIDKDAFNQQKKDEALVREASSYLWEVVLPTISSNMRENSSHQVPVDGRSLTEYLHQRGVNCRYIGRLAMLAAAEEAKDRQAEKDLSASKISKLDRRKMPLCWLELLECEMVARAAKHVLDKYFVEDGGCATSQPVFMISSFFSAIMSTSEESAADTENRLMKDPKQDDFLASTFIGDGMDGDASPDIRILRGRGEIWTDIDNEIGRRFRYSLRLYNSKDESLKSRALFIPLLRRVCQKTGVRLQAKTYDVGGKGLCDTVESFPICSSNIVDVVPMVKHAASIPCEGFVPCASGAAAAGSSLHILLPDAKIAFEAAQVHLHARALPQALDLAQEATSLYQRVVDSPLHIRISRCLDLTAVILYQAQEIELATINASRALAVSIQIGGFDCAETIPAHSTLCHIFLNAGDIASGVKHIRASMYVMEILGGPHYVELSNLYQRLGTIYHEIGSFINALRFYQEALNRKNQDRVVEGMLSKTSANILAVLSQFKAAFETEKRCYHAFLTTLGEEHELTKNSATTLKNYMEMAIEEGARNAEKEKKREEEEAADTVAEEIRADEEAEKKKKKKKPKKKKGN